MERFRAVHGTRESTVRKPPVASGFRTVDPALRATVRKLAPGEAPGRTATPTQPPLTFAGAAAQHARAA